MRPVTAEDTCLSVRSDLVDQLFDQLSYQASKVTIVDVRTVKTIVARGPKGDMPGYECSGRAYVLKANQSVPSKVLFIYTVMNARNLMGADIDASIVGISHVCGSSVIRDNLYAACTTP